MREITFSKSINEALDIALKLDSNVITYGLGSDDPKRIFGTTTDLQEKYGKERVFDMPTSENAMTGIGIGASLCGVRPVMVHQRVDFFLLALDQLVNNAAKWNYMFNGQCSVPITIRLIIGRGWGQGPTHAQNLHAWFSHIPGLKVVMPTFPDDAKGLLLSSIFDDNPVIFLEHRWLYEMKGKVPNDDYRIPLGKARLVREGSDITIVSMSYMTIEALHAVDDMERYGINCDLIDLRTIKPVDWDAIYQSVRKTSKLLVLDTGVETGSFAGEIITRVCKECWNDLSCAPQRVTLPDSPEPTSYALTKYYYPSENTIKIEIAKMLKIELDKNILESKKQGHHDVPGEWFKGPF